MGRTGCEVRAGVNGEYLGRGWEWESGEQVVEESRVQAGLREKSFRV